MNDIAIHGSHNASIAFTTSDGNIRVFEFERFLNNKNVGYVKYLKPTTKDCLVQYILKYIKTQFDINSFDTCLYNSTTVYKFIGSKCEYLKFIDNLNKGEPISDESNKLLQQENAHELIPAKRYQFHKHHEAHAACGFYQTNFQKALIFSCDGGGDDGCFNVYYAANRKEQINQIASLDIDLGFPYMIFGHFLNDIRFEPKLDIGNLVYAGKVMGLCSYGNCKKEWLPFFKLFFKTNPKISTYTALINDLGKNINVTFDVSQRLEGQLAWDIAKTAQVAFEEVFIELITPFIQTYKDIPIILVGGCALNIILNTRLKNTFFDRTIFIPPNPNDSGLAVGMLLNHIKPNESVDLTYSGLPILDEPMLLSYCEDVHQCNKINIDEVVEDLTNGKIIGIIQKTSEHGPRALGNRSIICNPIFSNMKEVLNKQIKNREWYRPFAPIVRLEDISVFFEWQDESRWMGFCPKVKPQWTKILSSITHVDGTARVQTVTKDQNELLYNLLTKMKETTGIGVLLNTSFNVNGKPILTSLKDAFHVFHSTCLHGLIVEEFYIKKQ